MLEPYIKVGSTPSPDPYRGVDALPTNISIVAVDGSMQRLHHQLPKSLIILWLIHNRYVSKVHVFVHAFADVVAELVDLFADVS